MLYNHSIHETCKVVATQQYRGLYQITVEIYEPAGHLQSVTGRADSTVSNIHSFLCRLSCPVVISHATVENG